MKTPAPRPGPLEHVDDQPAVVGNERTIALAGAVLLLLILVELVTVPILRTLLAVHVFVGVLLAGPLAVKLASTGYRFVRYYRGSPAFVRKGPPRLALRVLAPLLVLTTLVLVGSGIGLLVTGPSHPGPVIFLHGISFVLWLPMVAIHLFAYLRRVPRLIGDDWSNHRPEPVSPRGRPIRRESGRAAHRRARRRPGPAKRLALDRLDQGQLGCPGAVRRRHADRRTRPACHPTTQVAIDRFRGTDSQARHRKPSTVSHPGSRH